MSCAGSHENLGRTSTSFFPPWNPFFPHWKWQKFKLYGVNVQGAMGTVWMEHYTAVLVAPVQSPDMGAVLCPQSCPLGCDPRALPAPTAPPGIPGVVCRRCLPIPGASTSRHTAMETSRCFPKHSPAESSGETWDAVAAKDFPAPGLSDYFLFIVNCISLALW